MVHLALEGRADGLPVVGEEDDPLLGASSCRPRELVDGGPEDHRCDARGGDEGTTHGRHPGRGHEPQGEQVVAAAQAPPGRLVGLGPAGRHRVDRGPGLGQAEGQPLTGERVDVAGGVPDEEHPALHAAARALAQRAGAEHRGAVVAGDPVTQRREPLEQLREGTTVRAEDGDADLVAGRRGSRRPRRRRPSGPRPSRSMVRTRRGPAGRIGAARTVARRGRAAAGPGSAARRRRRGGARVRRRRRRGRRAARHGSRWPARSRHRPRAPRSSRAECSSVRRTPRPGAGRERRVHRAASVDVADAVDGPAVDSDAEVGEGGHRARHQPLTAGLVDDPGTRLAHGDRETGAARHTGRWRARRATAGDEEVTHGRRPESGEAWRARCSRCAVAR